jgi:hypothetical protein
VCGASDHKTRGNYFGESRERKKKTKHRDIIIYYYFAFFLCKCLMASLVFFGGRLRGRFTLRISAAATAAALGHNIRVILNLKE